MGKQIVSPKVAKEVELLNDKIAITELTTSSTVSDIQSQFNTLISSMADKTIQNVKIQVGADIGAFKGGIYMGTVFRWASNRVYVDMESANGDITGIYLNGSWTWSSLNSNMPVIKTETQTSQTDSQGNFRISVIASTKTVVCVYVTTDLSASIGAVHAALTRFYYNSNTYWGVRITDSYGNPVANTNITVKIVYIDNY